MKFQSLILRSFCMFLCCNICFASLIQLDRTPEHYKALAKHHAKQDVHNEYTTLYSFIYGCGLGIFAMPIAYFENHKIPTDRLIGKPIEYIETYTNTYKTYKKEHSIYGAFVGCSVHNFILLNACVLPALGFKRIRSSGHIRF